MPWLGLMCLLFCGGACALSRDTVIAALKRTDWGVTQGAPHAITAHALSRDDCLGSANVIPPTFVQSGWFFALCAAGAGLLVWALVRLRVRQVAIRMRICCEERLAERERIARELHDTLLQGTQGLILRFHAATDRMAPDDPTRVALGQALDRAEAVLIEGRDRVLDLRVSVEPQDALAEAYAAIGKEFGRRRPVSFVTAVEGTARALRPGVKDEIYRIGREALLNAFRHARATAIEIQIVYTDDKLLVRIRDDGTGVDACTLAAGSRSDHRGVRGMRERATRIGAELDFWSRLGAGTEIELSISTSRAYQLLARHHRWLASDD